MQNVVGFYVSGFPLTVEHNVPLEGYKLNIYSDVWRVSKPGRFYDGPLGQDAWSVFHFNHPTYQALSYSYLQHEFSPDSTVEETNASVRQKPLVPVIHDTGSTISCIDGVINCLFV
jgi:hypothetical protein